MVQEVWAGVARVTITPPVGSTWQGGYAARERPVQGIHDELVATALVLANGPGDVAGRVALVAADILNLSAEQVVTIRQLIAGQGVVLPERVMFLCSHTHGGPSVLHRRHPPVNAVYVAALQQQLASAVYAATTTFQPVRLSLGFGSAGFNINRRLRGADGVIAMRPNSDGPVDHTVAAIRLDHVPADDAVSNEGPFALLYRYACHATAMGSQNTLITADYPGAARRCLERVYAGGSTGTHALFLPGCFGDLRPNLLGQLLRRPARWIDGGFRSATWPELEALGRHLASAVDPTSGSTQQLTQHNSGATGNKLFYAGGLAMMTQLYDVTATVKGINKHFAWDVAPLPTGVKGLFDYVGGSAIGVSAQSKVKAAAAAWFFYVIGSDGQKENVTRQLGMPIIKSLVDTPAWKQAAGAPAHADSVVELLNVMRPISHTTFWRPLATQAFNPNINKLLSGQFSAPAACAAMDAAGNAVLRSSQGTAAN